MATEMTELELAAFKCDATVRLVYAQKESDGPTVDRIAVSRHLGSEPETLRTLEFSVPRGTNFRQRDQVQVNDGKISMINQSSGFRPQSDSNG